MGLLDRRSTHHQPSKLSVAPIVGMQQRARRKIRQTGR
jgi:hypothetical protein